LGTTVLIPQGAPPRAVVLIIHGSGPSDRDLTLPGGYHPYRDIGIYLAEHGYATVRFDKRAAIKDCAKKLGETLGVDVFLRDVQAVYERAKKLPGLDKAPLVLLGHSEGVTYANEIVARKLLDPKGLILVAGLGRYPIDATFLRQLRETLQRPEVSPAQRAALQKLIDEGSAYFMKIRSGEAKPSDFFVGAFSRFWTESIQITENAASTARATTQPALLLQGDKDDNITRDDFESLRSAFASRPLTEALILPNVTHLMTAVGETTVSPEVLARMDTWLQRLTAQASGGGT
jgi:alpha-beta hydrolase superfamily lysophospholipase